MNAHENASENVAAASSRPLRVTMYGVAGLLLLGACAVLLIAPEGATVEIPTRRYGRGQSEVGLWVLCLPFALAVLAAWYATVKLPRARLGKRRIWWTILLVTGPAVLFAIVAYGALT
ncbi:hypothetical protein ACIGCK_12470 [Microbacterium sp. NPDC078428]|uniref:hypothetical protein n=1 Tax=Microbacterium sp. NPDC078428 TaxID=3364190 RepID=UPI0037C9E7B0